MYVLSFRDLAAGHGGAVTPAAVLRLDGVASGFDWNGPASLRARLQPGGGARYVSWEQVGDVLGGRSVCFVLHGFNVDRDRGYASCGAMAQQLLGLGGALPGVAPIDGVALDHVVPVIWPGDSLIPGVNYPFELGDVRETGARFAELLRSRMRPAAVTFVSHSLGARVVLEAVQQTLARPGPAPRFETAVLLAAAANRDVLDDPRYAQAVGALERIVVVSSRKDSVLSDIFPLGNRVQAALWRGETASSEALGQLGPKPLKKGSPAAGKVRWFDIDPADNYGHDGYMPSPWDRAVVPDGWNARQARVAGFLDKALSAYAPPFAPGWPIDRGVAG